MTKATDETLAEGPDPLDVRPAARGGGAGAVVAGMIIGAIVGAGIALLFAPDAGRKTRGRLARRARHLGEDAIDRLDEAGLRARRELVRRRRRFLNRVERARLEARERFDEDE